MIKNLNRQIMYSTLRIEVATKSGSTTLGTGFLFLFDNEFPCLITNKHVVEDFKKVVVVFTKQDAGGMPLHGQVIPCDITNCLNDIIPHPSDSVDLVAIPLEPILRVINEHGMDAFCIFFTKKDIPVSKDCNWICPGCNVLMAGYPLGLIDDVNNLPIVRKGTIATDTSFDFGKTHGFLVDIANCKGSSGSPIIAVRTGFSIDWEARKINSCCDDCRLVGIEYSGITLTNSLKLTVGGKPFDQNVSINESANLACVIPSSDLAVLNDIIQKRYFSDSE